MSDEKWDQEDFDLVCIEAAGECEELRFGRIDSKDCLAIQALTKNIMDFKSVEVLEWAVKSFGHVAIDPKERGTRFLEEAIELAQTTGVERDIAHRLVDRCYDAEPGDLEQELSQSMLTLLALAANLDLSAYSLFLSELDRVQSIPQQEWEQRHDRKSAQGLAMSRESNQ